MSGVSELSGVLRRLSPQAYERVLLLVHCLVASNVDGSGITGSEALSTQAIADIVLSACPGLVPRFLFALSNNDKLFRSADCGLTWRLIFSRSSEPTKNETTGTQELLDDLQGLLNSTADAQESTSFDEGSSVVCSVDGYEDVVALCGQHGFLAVSGDRGATFTTATNLLESELGKNAHLRHVCVLDRNHILVSDGLRLVCVFLEGAGSVPLALGKTRVVLVCTTQVCMLHVCSMGGGVRCAVVAENGKLHFSFDGATSFLEVRHCLGRIRDFNVAAALRHCELPDFPEESLASSIGLPSTKDSASSPQSKPVYDYVSGYKCTAPASEGKSAVAIAQFEESALRYDADVFYRFFLVAGCDAEVLPYDYTALLCVCTRREGDQVVVVTTASNVSYIPFSQSRRSEKLICTVTRTSDGSGSYVASRGCGVGVSTSRDLARWSTPHGAAPVGLVSVGCGEVLVCGRNRVLSHLGGNTEAHTILNDMRVPILMTVFPM